MRKKLGSLVISSKVKELMKSHDTTIFELAERAKVASKTVERARGPLIRECRLSTLEAIAGALGVKGKDLFEEMDG